VWHVLTKNYLYLVSQSFAFRDYHRNRRSNAKQVQFWRPGKRAVQSHESGDLYRDWEKTHG
jgi:hypothetical protein